MVNFQVEFEFKPSLDNDDHFALSRTEKDLEHFNK